ncbi:hypothetical protein [Cellulomonas sp. Marseille-Q8402]
MTRQHILQAMAEHDTRGAEDFLGVYGYSQATGSTFDHEGQRYPSLAIVGVAHRFATGRLASVDEFHGGDAAVEALLRRRGFDLPEPATAPAAAPRRSRAAATPRARSTAPAKPRTVQREEVITLCPTCSMALPATGICDYCA